MKHGYIKGFQSGQINGINKVMTEAFMHNINLVQVFGQSNILEGMDMNYL